MRTQDRGANGATYGPPLRANGATKRRKASRVSALQLFAQEVTRARREFESNPDITTQWLTYFEAKQAAYAELLGAVPEVEGIEDFWRYVQNTPTAVWFPVIERQLGRIAGHHCRDCATLIPVTRELCDECRKVARAKTLRLAQSRKREEDKLPRCPECGTNPIRGDQRKCDVCKREARRSRNRRHRESLNQVKVRRVEAVFA